MASIVFNSRNKRKNRINSEKLFEFKKLTGLGCGDGAFRDNVRAFLRSFAEVEDYHINGMSVWCTSCVTEDRGVFPLYTIQETVQNSTEHPFCRHCELSGWGHHFVCKRKYHFIVPAKEHWDEPLSGDFEEIQYHNLYGVIHCNGYGHLISVSGLKNDSRLFSAEDNMGFWDCLCSILKARSISAWHVSTREAIELSLSHGIAYRMSWFGKWGYKFIGGKRPGITVHKYNTAIQYLSMLPLEKVVSDFKNKTNIKRVGDIIEIYRKFCGKKPVTLGDLLKFMLAFESRLPLDVECNSETWEIPMRLKTFVDIITRDCRWSAKRLEDVLYVIIYLLKQRRGNNCERGCGMSRQELRDEARKSIGDTGLIDFVLKSIRCLAVDNQIICRAVNPTSRLTEFTIYEITPGTGSHLGLSLSEDLMLLYDNVLAWYPETQIVMHGVFIKDWPIKVNDHSMELFCKVLPSFDELETELRRSLSPGVVMVVDPQTSVGDFKMMVQCALRDTYCIMEEFVVAQIGGLRKIDDKKALSATAEPGSLVWVRGHGLNFDTHLRYEDGDVKTCL